MKQPFFKELDLDSDPLLAALLEFYEDDEMLSRLTQTLRGPNRVSLRVLDWLVTNYAKRYNIVYPWNDTPFNIFTNYKDQLKGYRKSDFDPFCRRQRIPFLDSNHKQFETTKGQLRFFRWGLSEGVIDYCIQHAKEIEVDMLATQNHRHKEDKQLANLRRTGTKGSKLRRKELSLAAVRRCTMTDIPIIMRFSSE